MSNIILQAKDITRTYVEGKVNTCVLKKVNLDIYSDEITAIIGKSGSGKSTLLHILGTLDTQTSGDIIFNGQNLSGFSANQKAQFRNKNLGFVYQFHHLLGDFTAMENVMMPLLIGGTDVETATRTAKENLEKVGLSHRLNYRPSELSGGERQRVAIARALAHHPDLILADEPTGNLDAQNAQDIFALFTDLVRKEHIAVVMVTHDNSLAAKCDRVYQMKDGVIDAN
ncbi:lipoprotein-releasing system ATP-binding protein [Succinivibrio dextrinosolvens DSM 3072]|uniref:Lipoprotein-releasing system ATP-binding protein LolD n=1 Tax=Succinivibrio dextrinosolvens DSM 3072 TaxID=1123324 RepID=A0A1T4VSR0_9GAMM|nr:lipoprotein-releasing ABC transporter ATP-binding protein LolD [Succinivibrio dextrinosolvens]SKA68032.1 lipoprotein-releasing system ATP-binding protein [Succinivibrio dextrinosolvens DSM 3072]